MIHKLKHLFLLILCAGVIGGAITVSAQTGADKVLVAGKKTLRQSDIDRLIQFYEWAFQTEFDSAQRADFQRYTEKEFRANPTESRETIDDIVKTLPQILAASESLQADTRKNFLAVFLPQARQNSDANSQMLLSIYENANGTLPTNVVPDKESDDAQSDESYETVKKVKVGNLSSIAGKWVTGNTGSMTTTSSGVYVGGNASRHTYQFSADGTVEYTGIMNMMAGGCRTQIFKTAKGRANLNGATLTINWSPAAFSYENSCSASKSYKKTLPAETETFQIHFETYFDDKQLCLTGKDKTCMSPN